MRQILIVILIFTSKMGICQNVKVVASTDSILIIKGYNFEKKGNRKIQFHYNNTSLTMEEDSSWLTRDCELFEELVSKCVLNEMPVFEFAEPVNEALYIMIGSKDCKPLYLNHIWILDIKEDILKEKIAFFSFRKIERNELLSYWITKEIPLVRFPVFRIGINHPKVTELLTNDQLGW